MTHRMDIPRLIIEDTKDIKPLSPWFRKVLWIRTRCKLPSYIYVDVPYNEMYIEGEKKMGNQYHKLLWVIKPKDKQSKRKKKQRQPRKYKLPEDE